MAEWITTAEAAELSGYHPEHIRDLIRRGRVKGRKVSIVWLVDRKSLMAHLKQSQKLGEKRGPKKSN